MRALVRTQHAAEAWYAHVPYSLASKIMRGGWSWSSSGEPPSPSTPIWVVIMHGDFTTPDGKRYRWIAATLDPNGYSTLETSRRMDTFGVKLTPLPL